MPSLTQKILESNRRIQSGVGAGAAIAAFGLSAANAVILFGRKSATAIDCAVTFRGNVEEVTGARIPLDAALSQSHEMTAEVTEHAVEDGSLISDNIVNKPRRLRIDGVITDAPIRFLSGIRTLLDGGDSRSQSAFEALSDLYDQRRPFIVSTRRKIYHSVVFISLVVRDDADTVESLRFTADLKQIRFAEQAFSDISVADSVVDRAQPRNNVGAQPTSAPSAPAEDRASVLYKLLN